LEGARAQAAARVLGIEHIVLPDFRGRFGEDLRPFKGELDRLNRALFAFYQNPKALLIAPFRTIAHPLPRKEHLPSWTVAFGDEVDLEEIRGRLFEWGYRFVDLVTEVGEASLRGDILDIFPPNLDAPVRISLFDTQVESLRPFDPGSQLSHGEELEEVTLIPALYAFPQGRTQVEEEIAGWECPILVKDIYSLGFWLLERTNLLEGKEAVCSGPLPLDEYYQGARGLIDQASFELPQIPPPKRWWDINPTNIEGYAAQKVGKKRVRILASSPELLRYSSIPQLEEVELILGDGILQIESKEEVILSLNRFNRPPSRPRLLLDELEVGNYVVHEIHGVGIFQGIEQLLLLGGRKDFVALGYEGGDRLLVPVEQLDLLSRYVGSGEPPKLDRLGSRSFARSKERVRTKLMALAQEIIDRAAKRALARVQPIPIDFQEVAKFQGSAGFSYTPDQQRAIQQIFARLEQGEVLDMLLSGDVGFGKSEVALNALFAVAKAGYQGAMVVPTTLLSAQHYHNFRKRLEPFGIRVGRLDRFVSAKERRALLEDLAQGKIDVLVGTHALLEASFANLALVVVDEEHKFGVKQKERLKELGEGLHLLSMSATPIPRSLNMALSNLKELVTLETPPSIRQEVRTFVREYSDALVKEVILRELRRGGQLFYIYNSIAQMEQKRQALLQLLPQLRILTLHSKVPAATSERELLRFAQGEYDLLLSTSILESGIHMPRVNTIIVEGADRFGISDLHQLRGRVGRGGVEGYCYFLIEDAMEMSEEAKRRLVALESNSFIGSGALLAQYDLEIRGGGNILGAQQSGHIKGVGYGLYVKMLEGEIRRALAQGDGGEAEEEKGVELRLSVNAYLSPELIGSERVKLELYRRLAQARSLEEVGRLAREIEDRFGKLDRPSRNFLDLIAIKLLAARRGIKRVSNYGQNITLESLDGRKHHLKAPSKDEEDLLATLMAYLKGEQ